MNRYLMGAYVIGNAGHKSALPGQSAALHSGHAAVPTGGVHNVTVTPGKPITVSAPAPVHDATWQANYKKFIAAGMSPSQAANYAGFVNAVSTAPEGAAGTVLSTIANASSPATPTGQFVPGQGVVPVPPPSGGTPPPPSGGTPPPPSGGTPPPPSGGTPPPPSGGTPPSPTNGQPDPNYAGGGYGGGDSGGGGGGGGAPLDDSQIDWGDGSPPGGGSGGGTDNTAELADVDSQIMNMMQQAMQQGQGDGGDSSTVDQSFDQTDQADSSDASVVGSNPYLIGACVLGVDVIPQVGANYTDAKTVTAVQAALVEKGYDVGDSGVDGIFGAHTKAAIKKLQKTMGYDQTGIIDENVVRVLQVTPGVLPPGVTARANSMVQAQVALDAATAAEHSVTPQDVQAAATQVESAAPAAPPELVQAVQKAKFAAATATTPAQVATAKQQVVDAAQQVHAAVAPGWWSTPMWDGAPKRWQGAVGLGGGVAVAVGLGFVLRRRG